MNAAKNNFGGLYKRFFARLAKIDTETAFYDTVSHLGLSGDFKRYIAERGDCVMLVYPTSNDVRPRLSPFAVSTFERFAGFKLLNRSKGTVLLSDSPFFIQNIIDTLRGSDKIIDNEIAEAIAVALANHFTKPPPMKIGGKDFIFGDSCYLMGVLNVTPDSFSDGGLFATPRKAVNHALKMADAGAHIIDIGGESTRPGSKGVSAKDEIARVIPVIKAFKKKSTTPVSIDTTKAKVALEAIKAGADMINDTSNLRFDTAIARVAADTDAPLCLMHSRHTPKTMQKNVKYHDALTEIINELREGIERAERQGLAAGRIILDPGIGFSKGLEHNLALLARLKEISVLGRPVLVGPSRKSFIGFATGALTEDRLPGTIAAAAFSVAGGADFLRVHDVAAATQAVKLSLLINGA